MWCRSYSTKKHLLPAKAVRNRFLEFFINENEHQFIRSSPVASVFDPTIPFINAGMCQFKRVFTGEEKIDCTKAANTQKCIRIGGKHNDLNLVGIDSYHHTFFEMLGNWSFGAYSKKKACKLAWELLTTAPYSISPSRLFVTYFGGDEKMDLPADEEIKNIWLELGVSPDRILPFGVRENFWEMGLTGPCGTCTEIHIALTDEFRSKHEMVNKGHPLLAELWNIVFIKYNRFEHSIEALPKEYIDTGMGFERLTTILQGQTSNYDTDLFSPLFDKITERTGAPKYRGSFDVDNLDTSYRRLADFCRMITVAITDNIFPEVNPKLRRILRKALCIAKYDFNFQRPHQLIHELSAQIADHFHEIFPEIGNKLEQVNQVVNYEKKLLEDMASKKGDSWRATKSRFPELKQFSFIEYPGLPDAFLYLKDKLSLLDVHDSLSAEIVHHLYNRYGLDQPIVERLSEEMNFSVDWKKVEEFFVDVKNRSRNLSAMTTENFVNVLHSIGVETDDIAKFSYSLEDDCNSNQRYVFPDLNAELVAIVNENEIASVINKYEIHVTGELKSKINAPVKVSIGKRVALIFDKSNFFSTADGQDSDKGSIHFVNGSENISFVVDRVQKQRDIVIHYSHCNDASKVDVIIRPGTKAILKLDAEKRLQSMRNHTISHLISLAIQDLYPASYFKSFMANDAISRSTFRVLGKQFDPLVDRSFIEERLREYISRRLPINKTVLHSVSKLLNLPEIRLKPGKFYTTKDIQVITIADENEKIISREACDGTYLLNTGDLGKFNIVELKITPSSDLVVVIVAGPTHTGVPDEEKVIHNDTERLETLVNAIVHDEAVTVQKVIDLSQELSMFLYKIAYETSETCQSVHLKECLHVLSESQKKVNGLLKKFPKASVSGALSNEIKQMKNEGKKCVVYFTLVVYPDLRKEKFKISVCYNEFPTMFFGFANNWIHGLCYVPEQSVTDTFNAELWMNSVFRKHKGFFKIREEDDTRNYCFMSDKFLHRSCVYPYIDSLIKTSYNVAQELIK